MGGRYDLCGPGSVCFIGNRSNNIGINHLIGESIMTDLSSKAMLVKVSISQWQGKRFDKKATRIAEQAFQTRDAGEFQKSLVAQDAIKAVGKVANEIRSYHYANTLPWDRDGWQILPAKHFQVYTKEMRVLKSKFETGVDVFTTSYPGLINEARIRLNGLFRQEDYPIDIKSKFSVSTDIEPIPMAADFRVTLHSDEVTRIRDDIKSKTDDALKASHADLYKRLATAVGAMAAKLGDPKGVFRDTLVENLVDLVQLIPQLDIQDDPELDALRREVEEKLCANDPSTLRTEPETRAEVRDDAQAILKAMGA
jgi:hypothetical protein